jgi:signal transduction histidine kinase
MNLFFLFNALVLSFLGIYLYAEKRNDLTRFFLISNLGLAVWNVCIWLTEEKLFTSHIDWIAKMQLLSALVFVNGYFWLCSSYPFPHTRPSWAGLVNGSFFAVLAILILFTHYISRATMVNGAAVYEDTKIGYGIYTFYISFFCVASLVSLARAFRQAPEYRSQIKYLFLGIGLFVVTGISSNIILLVFGNHDVLIAGRVSAIFPSLFFSYAIVKHSFLEMDVIINKRTAWIATLLLACGSLVTGHLFTRENDILNLVFLMASCSFWALYAVPLQQFLLTSAKRKFIRGWYSTEAVIQELAEKITQDKNREEIFRTVSTVIDKVFEIEHLLVIVAVRDINNNFAYYKVLDRFQKVSPYSSLLNQFEDKFVCCSAEELEDSALQELAGLGMQDEDMVILPFHSPENLEGIIVLGERSSQKPYVDNDRRLFNNVISFIAPVLYRLTPMEKLEKLYNENRKKLHDAEIQLIRAQKVESIAHATRQCHHEIRTPLNIIKMGINRIKTLEELENYKTVAREEIDHALEIVDETLAITDIADVVVPASTRVNMNDVINRCLRLVDYSKYKVVLELGEIPDVLGNFSDLQVVITNLIHNAMDAMPEGGTLAFTTAINQGQVTINVEDTGEGIPEEVQSRVWDPYFSGKASDVGNSTAGRGWGLTIVNRIINEHKGTIRFSSELGVGTRFNISLPLYTEAQAVPVRKMRAEKVS